MAQVKEVLIRGAGEMALSTNLETHAMKWDAGRTCWISADDLEHKWSHKLQAWVPDGYRYDASRFGGRFYETPDSKKDREWREQRAKAVGEAPAKIAQRALEEQLRRHVQQFRGGARL